VIAIIAILASMLLPALGRAKEVARRATCMNNMKQLLLINHHYADDYNGMLLARTNNASGYGNLTWRELLERADYIQNRSIVLCPAAAPETWSSANSNSIYAGRRFDTFSAAYDPDNAFLSVRDSAGLANAFNILYMNRLHRPSSFVYFMDSWHMTNKLQIWTVVVSAGASVNRVAAHHAGKANIGFMDGHVEGLRGHDMIEYGVMAYYMGGKLITF
jgi:prepilin-type processing-associated H-X9-DG protein